MLSEYLKHLVIRTPMEPAAHWIRDQVRLPRKLRHPELSELFEEGHFIGQAFKRLLRADSNCIDVGAHLGSQLSVFLSLAPRGKHIAIEPVPYKAKWLREKFPEVRVHEVALSDSFGQVSFFINTARTGFSSLKRREGEKAENVEQISVEQLPLDQLVGDGYRADLIKIDVEGWELLVLKGAKRLLARARPTLVFESTDDGLKASGVTPTDIFEFMRALNYQVYLPRTFAARGPALTSQEFAAAHVYPFRAFNFLATPRIAASA